MEMIEMSHPDVPHTKDQPVVRSLAQYEAVWKEKGWELVKPKPKTANKEKN